MRILTFLHSFEPGGVERIALRLVRQWRSLGVDAPLYLGRTDGAMRGDVGADLDHLTLPQPRFGTAWCETLWMIATLPRIVRELRPDVLFCAGNTYMVVAVALKFLLGRSCPPVVAKISNDLGRTDQLWAQRLLYRLWLRMQGRFVDHVVGMERPMLTEIEQALAVPREAITIIPDPALSRDLIARLRQPGARPAQRGPGRRFVAVARFAPQKNLTLMLRAFNRAAAPGDTLTVIGDGPERDKLRKLASRLGLGDRCEFPGYASEPADILPAYDVLLLSSNYEGVPAVILEALAAGLEIVATDCSRSMATLLRHGALGQLVPVGDERALAQAIAAARPGTQDQALSLGQAERFTLEHAAEAYLDVVRKVLRSPAPNSFLRRATEVPFPLCRQGGQTGDARS